MMTEGQARSLWGYSTVHPHRALAVILLLHLLLALRFASVGLDIDEFEFVREPYELLGGDYTKGYLKQREFGKALDVARRAYWFYWKYRPLNAPLVAPKDRRTFAEEEREFGYVAPTRIARDDPEAVAKYKSRLIVPEPDRMYRHGAGKPLLPALLMVPQLGLTSAVLGSPRRLLEIQFSSGYHAAFILVRLDFVLAGLLAVFLTYWLLQGFASPGVALVGAAILGLNPISVSYFPNIHHDAIMVPFLLGSMGLLIRRKLVLGGIAFGLALASKNSAILVAPAMAYLLLSEKVWSGESLSSHAKIVGCAKRILLFAVTAIVVLVPFANPISYTKELLTPVSGRAYDSRGENIAGYSLVERGGDADDSQSISHSVVRPEIDFLQRVTGFKFTLWFPALLGMLLMALHLQETGSRAAWIWMLAIFPAGAVFSYSMNYRALMFLPPFAILGATLLPRRWAWLLVLALCCASVVYAWDPMTVNIYHTPVR